MSQDVATYYDYALLQLNAPGDFLYVAFPVAFPTGSPALSMWLAGIERLIYTRDGLPYCEIMDLCALVIRTFGLEGGVSPPAAVCPLDRLKAQWMLLKSRRHLFNSEAIDAALLINNCAASSSRAEDARLTDWQTDRDRKRQTGAHGDIDARTYVNKQTDKQTYVQTN